MRKIIASLDIGSDLIKLVVGESLRGKIHILGASHVPSYGIKRGFVVDYNSLLSQLKEVFLKCEDMIGLKITKVILNVPSQGVSFSLLEGSNTITNNEHIVKSSDIIRVMQSATYNQIDNDSEIVSIQPTSFLIDDERTVKNPLGMEATKISVKTLVATIPRDNVFPFVQCLQKIGVDVIDFSLSSIGDYYQFLNNSMKEVVGAIVNIGHQITEISIFNKGLLTNMETLNIGSYNLEHDFCYIFGITGNDAKILKGLSAAHKRGTSASIKKEFTTKEGNSVSISEYEASEVASSRIEEILKLVKKQINLLTKKEIHYIMITGGVSEMTNFSILVEEVFGHNATVGVTKELGVRSNIYSTSVGLIKYYDEKTKMSNTEFSIFNEAETEELSNVSKKVNFDENSILGKLFGYFFDN